ncbi:MAG TPA: cyclic pyranopterin monophosphate synthase MoaC [Candidatus Pullilachnospira intestinigallinarum]|nr:cyclic pyranopterin monophosphate synthase MoaC [Candidatus Pullilachnospira intestinigallinarum]
MQKDFSHFDEEGNAVMVDVTEKQETFRSAVASGFIQVNEKIIDAIQHRTMAKGDVLGVARVAGIMGAKETSRLIPMCHTLLLSGCTVDFRVDEEQRRIYAWCTVKTRGQTGVEMEALTGVSTALLTIYDMCKAVDRNMVISEIRLEEKQGGRSGVFRREEKRPREK